MDTRRQIRAVGALGLILFCVLSAAALFNRENIKSYLYRCTVEKSIVTHAKKMRIDYIELSYFFKKEINLLKTSDYLYVYITGRVEYGGRSELLGRSFPFIEGSTFLIPVRTEDTVPRTIHVFFEYTVVSCPIPPNNILKYGRHPSADLCHYVVITGALHRIVSVIF